MRLLISAYACAPHRGSEPGNGWNWALRNAMAGHEVWCITTNEGRKAIENILPEYRGLKLQMIYVEVPQWVNYLYRFQPFVYFHYLVWQHRAARTARALDKEVDFQLIHHVTLASLQLGSGLWRLHKPLIFGPVGGGNFAPSAFKKYFSGEWFMEIYRKMTSVLLLRFNRDAIVTIRNADLVLVANNDTLRMANNAGAKKTELFLDTALSDDFFSHHQVKVVAKAPPLRILWVGRIFARKGLRLVLEALSMVSPETPFHLTILGDGKQGKMLSDWLKEYDLESRVTWKGQVPWDEVKEAYREHDVFMFCSLRDSFGSQFLEAMAFGLPIITLNHQGAGDHIPFEAGIKVSVTTPETTNKELAEAVTYMYGNPSAREQFGYYGKQFAKQHQWEAKIRQMNDHYCRILGYSPSSGQPRLKDNNVIVS